ncbi:MAG: ImmA/IrrE family metallo-endopeptidase [Bacteroidetes bacterium]|nr:ImmA/IrrE family metallo-endopeptidase [Bacteroidota bacterium]
MATTINPAMLVLARESRGMNQKDLAEKISISVSNISKMENSVLPVPVQALEQIAGATNYPKEFFFQKADIVPDNLGYRRRQVVSQKILTPINAQVNIIRQNVQFLTRAVNVPLPKLPAVDVSDAVTPQLAAKQVRKSWKIKGAVIDNLIQLLEEHGIAISAFDFNTARVDSRSILTEDNYPIIVYNRNHLGDRQRFTLAHELGHLVMHTFTNLKAEQDITHEANLFAAELLMPETEIRKDLKEALTIPRLAELKRKWKVSMISILYRADDLGYLTPNQKHYLIRQFNNLNIRRREPVELDVAIEQPKLIRRWIAEYKALRKLNTAQVAAALNLNTDEFVQVYS